MGACRGLLGKHKETNLRVRSSWPGYVADRHDVKHELTEGRTERTQELAYRSHALLERLDVRRILLVRQERTVCHTDSEPARGCKRRTREQELVPNVEVVKCAAQRCDCGSRGRFICGRRERGRGVALRVHEPLGREASERRGSVVHSHRGRHARRAVSGPHVHTRSR